MPTTTRTQAAKSRSSITDTGNDLSSIEGVANVSFDDYIKWHTLQNSGISGVVEGEESNQLESVINVSIQLTGEVI